MLSDRFITRHTPLEHLLLEPPVTELERELQRRLRGSADEIDTAAPLLDAINDAGISAENVDALGDLLGAARRIDSDDLAEGAKFLGVLNDRGFEGGQSEDLDELLHVCASEDIVLGTDLQRLVDEHCRMRDLLERAKDLFEAIDGTNPENEQLLDEYRAFFTETPGEVAL